MGMDGNQRTNGRLHLAAGGLALDIADGNPRRIRFHGTEVLRLLSYPVRDCDWGTLVAAIEDERHETEGGRLCYENRFAAADGSFRGSFRLESEAQEDGARIVAAVEIVPAVDLETNRAGFAILHPLAGVSGGALTVRHADGSQTRTTFPERIRADAPALDVAGLRHRVGPVDVDIAFSGDVFEMEDQRNWSDASYKTFCRPLAWPCPFVAPAGEPIRQEIRITLRRDGVGETAAATPHPATRDGLMPHLCWTADLGDTAPEAAALLPGLGVSLRLTVDAEAEALSAWRDAGDLTLEIVLPEGDDGRVSLPALARACSAAGVAPARIVALPGPCLKCLPARPTPADILPAVRAAFPQAAAGGGSLTLFTEMNAAAPDPELVDFVTFGNAAIVHAADDESVIETLEALPHVFASATALAGGRPLRLGLIAIGLRTNPYGEDVAPNPGLFRLPMARRDPRQHERFAAAYGVGVLAAAAMRGVGSLSLAMPDGDLGVSGPGGLSPLFHVIRAAARLSRARLHITHGPHGMVLLEAGATGIAANTGSAAIRLELPAGTAARVLDEVALPATRADALWMERAPASAGPVTLAPFDVAFLSAAS